MISEATLKELGELLLPFQIAWVRDVRPEDYGEGKAQGFCESVLDDATGELRHRITSKGMLQWEQGEREEI